MAEINICAMDTYLGGPSMPSHLSASIKQHEWIGGDATSKLTLYLGKDSVTIWPSDPNKIEELILSLQKCVKELRGENSKHCKNCNGRGYRYDCLDCNGTGVKK